MRSLDKLYDIFEQLPMGEMVSQYARKKLGMEVWEGYKDWRVEQICRGYKDRVESGGELNEDEGIIFGVLAKALLENRMKLQDAMPVYIQHYWNAVKNYYIEAGITDNDGITYDEQRRILDNKDYVRLVCAKCGREAVLESIVKAHEFLEEFNGLL